MSNFLVSLIRTYVPVVVGFFLAQLAKVGLDLELSDEQVTWLVGAAIAAYYAAARALERRWPKLGWLLGLPKQPEYVTPPPAAKEAAE